MIRRTPVKAFSRNDQNLFFMKEIQGKSLIIQDMELLRIDPGEYVKGGLWLDCRDPGDVRQSTVNKVSLLVDPAARLDIFIDALVAPQGCLDNGLGGHIGAQAHG